MLFANERKLWENWWLLKRKRESSTLRCRPRQQPPRTSRQVKCACRKAWMYVFPGISTRTGRGVQYASFACFSRLAMSHNLSLCKHTVMNPLPFASSPDRSSLSCTTCRHVLRVTLIVFAQIAEMEVAKGLTVTIYLSGFGLRCIEIALHTYCTKQRSDKCPPPPPFTPWSKTPPHRKQTVQRERDAAKENLRGAVAELANLTAALVLAREGQEAERGRFDRESKRAAALGEELVASEARRKVQEEEIALVRKQVPRGAEICWSGWLRGCTSTFFRCVLPSLPEYVCCRVGVFVWPFFDT